MAGKLYTVQLTARQRDELVDLVFSEMEDWLSRGWDRYPRYHRLQRIKAKLEAREGGET